MAENKKSFILYCDQKNVIDMLPDDIAGKLLKHIFSYVNDENPTSDDLLIKLAFEPIKMQLKRDLIKFEDIKLKRSDAGKLSAELRIVKSNKQNLTKSTSVESVEHVEQVSTESTVNVSVSGKC